MGARLAFLLAVFAAGALTCVSSRAAFADDPRTVDAGKPVDDPMQACLAAGQKALDLEKLGKLLDARTQLALCAAPACGQYVSPACQKRIQDITVKLPSIILLPRDSEGSELQGVQVTIDGSETRTLDGKPVTLDPGAHTFRFEAVGLRPSERTYVLVEGAQGRQEQVIVGVTEAPPADAAAPAAAPEDVTPAPAADAAPTPAAEATPAAAPPEPTPVAATPVPTERTSFDRSSESVPGGGNKVPAFVVGGVGVLGVAVGSVLGAMAFSDWSSSQSDCHSTMCTANLRPRAVHEHDSAKTEAAGSTVGFAVGGVALVAAAYLFFNPPGQERTKMERSKAPVAVEPSVSPAYAGLSLHGAFE
jgi:hypothetical protein